MKRHLSVTGLVGLVAVGILVSASTAGAANLIGWWPFDTGSGPTAFDLSPGGNDGTINGATWVTDPVRGTVLDFNGSSDYVAVGPIGFAGGSAPRTISGWARSQNSSGDDADWSGIFGFTPNTSGCDRYFDIEVRGMGAPKAYCLHVYCREDNFPLLTNDLDWHHFAATYDGTTVKAYLDGNTTPAFSYTRTLDTYDEVNMGRREAANAYFTGRIDQVTIYDGALAPNQIAHLASNGDPTNLPAAPAQVFYVGVDNNSNSDFDHENDADDHYYWENGDYSGLGTGGANWAGGQEPWSGGDAVTGFDRALTPGDPTNYIYFQLEELEAAADAQFLFTADMIINSGDHDVDFLMNGVPFHQEFGIGTKFVTAAFTGADVGAKLGGNVIAIVRTGGPGAYTQFDYVSLEVVPGTPSEIIPEPASLALLAAALAGLGGYVRRRRRA